VECGGNDTTFILIRFGNGKRRMIDFQSPATVKKPNHLAHRSPSPGGEGRGEGELNYSSGRQPALIKVGRAYPRAVLPFLFFHFAFLINVPCPSAPLRLCVRNPCPSWLKKGRNYETNPIFIATHCRPKTTEEKFSNSMISQTHGLRRGMGMAVKATQASWEGGGTVKFQTPNIKNQKETIEEEEGGEAPYWPKRAKNRPFQAYAR
jgi:hypothetical protein